MIPFPGTNIVNVNDGIDCVMCGVYRAMQAFICNPPLVIPDDIATSVRLETNRVAPFQSRRMLVQVYDEIIVFPYV